MSVNSLRNKLHEMVDKIDDEATLNILMEEAATYTTTKDYNLLQHDLTAEQLATIEKAKLQIQNGEYKTYEQVKEHFAQWLTK